MKFLCLHLYSNDFGDLGLDNFQFSQIASTIPEAETFAMLMAGLGLVGFSLRGRKLV